MLTRLRIDNFRCFVNFNYQPTRRNLILGRNGSGKSTLLDALQFVRQFAVTGLQAEGLFPLNQRTRWLSQRKQSFEIEAILDLGSYVYRVVIEPEGEPPRPRVASEILHLDGKPVFEFDKGEVHLYTDRFERKVTYPFEPDRSALQTISAGSDNLVLTRFKQWLGGMYCFRLNPFAMSLVAEGENYYPTVNLSNIAAWYRHLVQAYPRQNASLVKTLGTALDDFSFLTLEPAGENVRLLMAEFARQNGVNIRIGFNELSDGQRCLICLYVILHFVLAEGGTVILDEPENFVSLPEIQPWLMALAEMVEDGHGQILMISHHPELINQWAPGCGFQFVRDPIGSVRVEEFQGDPKSSLSPSELIARGWERG